VTFPTRACNGQGPSILDLIITYNGNGIDNLTATDPLGKSDHYMLEYEYVCSCDEPKSLNVRYLYDKGHYQNFTQELLNTNWEEKFEGTLADEMWSTFHVKYLLLVKKYIPTQPDNNSSLHHNGWINLSYILSRRNIRCGSSIELLLVPTDYVEYTRCRNASTQAVRSAKYNFEKGLINDLSVNLKRFWKYVCSKQNQGWAVCD